MNVETINKIIATQKENDEDFSAKNISDTHHTFQELYDGRMMMSAVICNTYSEVSWKSKLHDDGAMFDDMFIVGCETPEGSYTNHYPLRDWDLFEVIELEKARPWDGHTAADVGRLLSLLGER